MKTMDGELREMNESLYQLYVRSYNMAVEHWLPQVKSSKDSYNSLPHLIGVKKRIDRILYPEDGGTRFQLSAFELYVLLNAILFHDIGKGVDGEVVLLPQDTEPNDFMDFPETSQIKPTPNDDANTINAANNKTDSADKPKDANTPNASAKKTDCCASVHSYISMKLIQRSWAELGIVSEHVAHVIGDICKFHDALSTEQALPKHLFIDDFGPLRVNILGALLILGDQLDNTYTRIPPEFMKITGEYNKVGKFRSKIRSTWIDPVRRMACTEIDDTALKLKDLWKPNSAILEGRPTSKNTLLDYIYCYIQGGDCCYKHGSTSAPPEYQIPKADQSGDYENVSVLFSVMGNTCEDNLNLKRIQNELYILGMPIKKWMIEYNGHLFQVNYNIQEIANHFQLLPSKEKSIEQDTPLSSTTPKMLQESRQNDLSTQPAVHTTMGTSTQTVNYSATNPDGICLQNDIFEYKEYRIYPFGSRFALEPLLDVAYCRRILNAIYMLAGGILGKPYHDYYDLLNYIRADESSLPKVKCAVARLSKLLTLFESDNQTRVELYFDDKVWMFSIKPNKPKDSQASQEKSDLNTDTLLDELRDFLRDILE